MKREKQKGQAMHEVQRQTTEKTHKLKIAEVWVDYSSTCECGGTIYGDQTLSGKFIEECTNCGTLKTNL